MNTFCFLFIYTFEQFISYIFFSNKFSRKKGKLFTAGCFFFSFLIQYSVNSTGIPLLNIFTFLICNMMIVFLCFQATFKQNIFNVLLIASIMIATELLTLYVFSLLLGITLTGYADNNAVIFFETAATKSLYFFVVYIFSKISIKEKKANHSPDFSFALFILPLSSVIIFLCFMFLTIQMTFSKQIYIIFMIASFILLSSNIAVFYIHEKVVTTLKENAEYQLEKQKTEINSEYYAELEKQYNTSNILVHDFKHHLGVIQSLVDGDNTESIDSYIRSLLNSSELKSLKEYSKNRLINVIFSRYAQLCESFGIDFNVDIRNIELSFMADTDITALFDNLLENAYEAAQNSTEKKIDVLVEDKNETYILIKIKNSCDEAPMAQNGGLISSKSDKSRHGIGMKSIIKTAKKYNGNMEFGYNENEHSFCISVLIKNAS